MEIDPDVFIWRLQRKPSDDAVIHEDLNINDLTDIDGRFDIETDSRKKSLIKLKNLSKELRFITEGYFDFEEMIWKDQSDGRALNANDWYQDSSLHMRQGFISKLQILSYDILEWTRY